MDTGTPFESTVPSPARAAAIRRSKVSVRVLSPASLGTSVAPMTLRPSRSPRRQTPIPSERTTRSPMRWSSGPRALDRKKLPPWPPLSSDSRWPRRSWTGRRSRRGSARRSRGGRAFGRHRPRDGAGRRRPGVGDLHPLKHKAPRGRDRRARPAPAGETSEEELLELVARAERRRRDRRHPRPVAAAGPSTRRT